MIPSSEEPRRTGDGDVCPDLESPVTRVLDEVVVVEVVDEEPRMETCVGDRCVESLDPVPENPGTPEEYRLRGLCVRTSKSRTQGIPSEWEEESQEIEVVLSGE